MSVRRRFDLISHAAGVFTVLACASFVAVYGFGVVEIASPLASLLLGWALCVPVAATAACGFLVASRVLHRYASRTRSYVLGTFVGCLVAALFWSAPGRVDFAVGLAAAFLFSAAATLTCDRAAA